MSHLFSALLCGASLLLSTSLVSAQNKPSEIKEIGATALPASIKAKGSKIEQVWTWLDGSKSSRGYAVFSSTELKKKQGADKESKSRYLYVQLLSGADGGSAWQEQRLVQDMIELCAFDVTAVFKTEAIGVTDEDGDQVPELTFAYDLGCGLDVNVFTRKLLVLEGKDKHIFRGQSLCCSGDAVIGENGVGEYKAEGFAKQPKLKVLAEKRWAALLEKDREMFREMYGE